MKVVFFAHFVFDEVHDGVIEIFAAQKRIAADRNHIDRFVIHFQHRHIEGAAAQDRKPERGALRRG